MLKLIAIVCVAFCILFAMQIVGSALGFGIVFGVPGVIFGALAAVFAGVVGLMSGLVAVIAGLIGVVGGLIGVIAFLAVPVLLVMGVVAVYRTCF